MEDSEEGGHQAFGTVISERIGGVVKAKDRGSMNPIRTVLRQLYIQACLDAIDPHNEGKGKDLCEKVRVPEVLTSIAEIVLVEKKENIMEKEYMCCDDYQKPCPCLYDKPTGEICGSMDKKLPKEKCPEYKKIVVRQEDYDQWNACCDHIAKMIRGQEPASQKGE